MVFPVVMYGCESWTIKEAERWRIDVFELWCWRRLLSPLDYKEIKPVNPKGNQPWILIGKSDAEAETRILWAPDTKNWLIEKEPDVGRQEEKGTAEDEMVGWHHRLDGHKFEQASGVSYGQGIPACCSPRVCKESHTTEQLNWTESLLSPISIIFSLNLSKYFYFPSCYLSLLQCPLIGIQFCLFPLA